MANRQLHHVCVLPSRSCVCDRLLRQSTVALRNRGTSTRTNRPFRGPLLLASEPGALGRLVSREKRQAIGGNGFLTRCCRNRQFVPVWKNHCDWERRRLSLLNSRRVLPLAVEHVICVCRCRCPKEKKLNKSFAVPKPRPNHPVQRTVGQLRCPPAADLRR